MRAQVGRLRRLTTDVREAANAQEQALDLRLAPINPVTLAQAAVTAATPRYAARGVALTYHGPADAPTVHGDAERLAQILANLLDNALRHTPPAGHITVTVDTRPRQVLLRVADDGAGIPPDQLEAIFERFHRADPARPDSDGSGSGLGLTIARTIAHAHAHAGTLTADSTGRGATFTLTLPAA